MKFRTKLLCFVALSVFNTSYMLSQKQKIPVKEMMGYLSEDELIKHLNILTSDEMEGRKTGEAGQKMAANYLRNFYHTLGIEALPEPKIIFSMCLLKPCEECLVQN